MSKWYKRIDWLNHGLEFFVVIIGILIAFQLQNFSESVKRKETLANHRNFLLEETKDNQKSLKYALEKVNQSIGNLDSLKNAIESEKNVWDIKTLALRLLDDSGYFYIRRNAYKTITESGDIRFLEFEEKKKIVSLYGYYDWTEAIQRNSYDGFDNYFDYLDANTDLYTAEVPDRSVFESRVFSNVLGTYRYLLQAKQNKYRDCLGQIELFLQNQDSLPH
ncbi:hypothetical protein SAMN04490243_2662 [Robiginitalea myxolifaciens]|uniref:Uncharacterized protein n=1 Tax=Robiginitalea myxolifaciens TaxID=400055 RepID=A0A1I6HF55_9FLAO|nr:hypothetical protein [Robiginitalea myxolifaciens]SFR53014.1 hypothetical protein SAMN04490243_2662 [Robiginitalea myxolifaciens]